MPRITFVDSDGSEYPTDAATGFSLMEVARGNDVPGIDAECGGAGACATCHVYIGGNWFVVSGEKGRVEQDLLDLVADPRAESRLSCQVTITDEMDGMVVTLPEMQGF